MSNKLVIIGAGETANLAHEYFVHDSNYNVVAFAVHSEYRQEDKFKNLPLIDFENLSTLYPKDEFYIFIALASERLNYNRAKIYQEIKKLGYKCATYVSSKAFVWHNVQIGENCFILENNTLQPFVKIEDNVTLWSGNHIGHQSIIKNNVFISSHVVISGFCEIGENTFMGVNSCIADGVKIAKDNFIALGSVINKDTEENKIYRGNPAEASKISAKKFCKVKE
ncbi:acetyltransferase [Campylobacter coli]|uniref:acetyltransferase n=1 Tax=Campylobacter coli TaxID=195 RepID=UPI0009305043|nr:acetyltransferase [Campylobacter coli]HEG0588347.1 acetyltransferase [Campylobacter coli]HEG0609013.1 acetyltransferase [Campylobacter coli]